MREPPDRCSRTFVVAGKSGRDELALDHSQIGEAVDEELHGEGDQEQSHDADEDADAGFAHDLADPVGAGEDEIADGGGEGNASEDGKHLPGGGDLAYQHHDAGDGSGAGEHGDAEGHYAGVFFVSGFFGVTGGLLGGGALGLEHVETDEQEDQAAGHFKGGEGDAEHAEDVLASQGEDAEDDETGDAALAGHTGAAGRVHVGGDGQEGWDGGERIDQEEDGADGEQGETEVGRGADFVEDADGWVIEDHPSRLTQQGYKRQTSCLIMLRLNFRYERPHFDRSN